MSYHLFLDDDRKPSDVTWVELPLHDWVIVRNYDQFLKTITERGIPTTVTFDHDLAHEHYSEYHAAHDPKSPTRGVFRYDRCKEKTGYDCAKWLAELCVQKNIPIPLYYIHTKNPVGAMNIFSIMESARKVLTSGQ